MRFNLHYLKTDYNTTLGALYATAPRLNQKELLINNNEGQLEENPYDLSNL